MDHNDYSDQFLKAEGFEKVRDIDFGEAVVIPLRYGFVCFKLRGSYGELWLTSDASYISPTRRFLLWLKRLVSWGEGR